MKLVQFWFAGLPALGIQTEQGIIDVAAEGARRGIYAPTDMKEAIAMGVDLLKDLAEGAECFTDAPLAPVITGTDRVFCIGLNYRQHAKECNLPLPPAPVLFNKFGNALAAHEEEVTLLPDYKEYDYPSHELDGISSREVLIRKLRELQLIDAE